MLIYSTKVDVSKKKRKSWPTGIQNVNPGCNGFKRFIAFVGSVTFAQPNREQWLTTVRLKISSSKFQRNPKENWEYQDET